MRNDGWFDMTYTGSSIKRRMKIEDGKMVEEASQDLSIPLREIRDKRLADRRSTSLWDGRSMVHVASIPMLEIERLYRQGLNIFDKNDAPKIMALLNTGDYEKLRTAPGRFA